MTLLAVILVSLAILGLLTTLALATAGVVPHRVRVVGALLVVLAVGLLLLI